jgi:hypothetical protein
VRLHRPCRATLVTDDAIRNQLDALLEREQAHAERIAIVVGLLSEAFGAKGLQATVVDGSALELHAPGVYATLDIDLVVEGGSWPMIEGALTGLGFERRGRQWVRGNVFIDVVGRSMSDPVEVLTLGDLRVRVISKEVALADRIIGFKWWRYSEYGAQSVELIRALEDTLDERLLRDTLAAQQAEDAYAALQLLVESDAPITAAVLESLLEQLHGRTDSRSEEG